MKTTISLLAWAAATVALPDDLAAESLFDETKATTLFSFDDVSIPFSRNLKLEMQSPERHPDNPVLRRGKPGSADSWAVQFYGSVIREDDKFRMWYVAVGEERFDKSLPRSHPWRVAYAESDDGVNWIKPELGLVEFLGKRNTNHVRMEPRLGVVNVKVILDPDDPDPNRRYKMGAHVWWPRNEVRLGNFAPYVSADGLNWNLLGSAEPVDCELPRDALWLPPFHFEPVGGFYLWNGLYHLSGQNGIPATRPYHGRVVRTFVSPDFDHWNQESTISFVRAAQHQLLGPGRSLEGEQTHEGISVWNRGNVLVGLSGRWHGAPEWKDVTIDLGLVISNDGLRFREPAEEWSFLERGKDGAWDQGGLLQGQGFENVGEQTFVYYGAWDPRSSKGSPPRGGVGIATLPRDRFGALVFDESTTGDGNYQTPDPVGQFMTAPVDLRSLRKGGLFLNAEGLGDGAALKIELLDERSRPLPEFSGEKAFMARQNGFQCPLTWMNSSKLGEIPDTGRFRVTFDGENRSQIRFYALYLR